MIRRGIPRPVVMIHPDGHEEVFPSGGAASRVTGVNGASISHLCNGKKARSKGFRARFADQEAAKSTHSAELPQE